MLIVFFFYFVTLTKLSTCVPYSLLCKCFSESCVQPGNALLFLPFREPLYLQPLAGSSAPCCSPASIQWYKMHKSNPSKFSPTCHTLLLSGRAFSRSLSPSLTMKVIHLFCCPELILRERPPERSRFLYRFWSQALKPTAAGFFPAFPRATSALCVHLLQADASSGLVGC